MVHNREKDVLNYLSSAPCGFFRCVWDEDRQDFKFAEVNGAGEKIIGLGKLNGLWMCETVKGHRIPLKKEGGLSLVEIYRRIAFKEAPYESGKRGPTLLEFKSPQFITEECPDGKCWFDQIVEWDQDGEIFIWCSNVTNHILTTQELRKVAMLDQVCSIPDSPIYSRVYLFDQLKQAIDAFKNRNVKSTLITLDLDKFKRVNDVYGHVAGDIVLKTLAQRIKFLLEPNDVIARQGGDEFAVLLWGKDAKRGYGIAENILETLKKPISLGENAIIISGSIGISEVSLNTNPTLWYTTADTAETQAKAAGGDLIVSDSPEIYNYSLRLEEIKSGLIKGEFVQYYQPIVDLQHPNWSIVGWEALCRWELGNNIRTPVEFIPVLEQSNNMHLLCSQMLSDAADIQKKLKESNCNQWVSVNVHALTLAHPSFEELVAPVIKSGVHIELTEEFNLSDKAELALELLRKQGVKIALDDTGVGRFRLPLLGAVDILKIDKSLVKDVAKANSKSRIACHALIHLANNFNLKVVAEGIETIAQAQELTKLGCHCGQGYLFGEAMKKIPKTPNRTNAFPF